MQHPAHHGRYARQHALREFGMAGQEKLARGRVLIVGAGGLGSPAAMYLVAAGVGTIGLVDTDVVDESNLHRQLLYGMHDVGTGKLQAAGRRLADINPLVQVVLHDMRLTAANARELVAGYDIVVDGSDNFQARYAINDACVALGVPFVYGSVARFEGQVSLFAAPGGPCYRCLFPTMPEPGSVPNCAEDGVLGVLPGIVGLQQSTEAIKWLAGLGRSLAGRLLMLDLLDGSMQEISIARDPACTACGTTAWRPAATPAPDAAGTSVQRDAMPEAVPEIDVTTLAAWLRTDRDMILLDVREPWEAQIASLPGATLIPLATLTSATASLDAAREYVVYCHHGMRSAMAAEWLKSQGFERVFNLSGGIDAWSAQVDAAMPRY